MAEIRNLNTFTLGAGFNVTSGEAIDSRQYVTSIEQIYSPDNWEKVKPYNGLLVISADGEARICIDADNYQLETSWKKVGGDTAAVDELQQAVTAMKQKLDTVEEGAQVNAIEEITVDGAALSIVGRSVNIDLASALAPYAKTEDVNNELATKVSQTDFDALAEEVGNPKSDDAAATGIYKVIEDVETALKADITSIPKFKIEVVDELPETGDPATVYLVKEKESEGDLYTEYIYVNDAWDNLGKQTVDLSAYSTTEQMNSAIAEAIATVYSKSEVDNLLAAKADSSELDNYVLKTDAESAHEELSNRIQSVSDKADANESAISELKVKDVDGTAQSGVALELADGIVKVTVDKTELVSDLVGAAGQVGDLSGSNLKLGKDITATVVDGEGNESEETIIDSTVEVSEAIQTLAGQIQSAVAGGITGISGDNYISVGGSATSKSLSLNIAVVQQSITEGLISTDSAIRVNEEGKLQLTWSSL